MALTGLTEDGFEQMSLFEDCAKKEQRQKLDAAMDAIRMKFGNDKITRASIMNSNAGIRAKSQGADGKRRKWKKILKEIEKRTLSFPLQGSAMFFLHRKHGFVPYVKNIKNT
ncbi:MAG: hypothetical protein ACLTER_16910 [Ruminococcus sp.]